MHLVILLIIAAITGGSTPVAGKYILQSFHPFEGIFFRFLFASTVLFFTLSRAERSIRSLKENSYVAFIGALNPILFFIALPYIQASVTPLIYASVPLFTALYNRIKLQHRYTYLQLSGLFIGFAGVALIIFLPLIKQGIPLEALKGNALILVGAVIFTWYGIVSQKAQKEHGVSARAMTYYFSLMTLVLSLPFVACIWAFDRPIPADFSVFNTSLLLYIGIVGTAIAYLSYQSALKKGGTLSASLFTFLQPVATFTMAFLFLGEKIDIYMIMGGMLATLGPWMVLTK